MIRPLTRTIWVSCLSQFLQILTQCLCLRMRVTLQSPPSAKPLRADCASTLQLKHRVPRLFSCSPTNLYPRLRFATTGHSATRVILPKSCTRTDKNCAIRQMAEHNLPILPGRYGLYYE